MSINLNNGTFCVLPFIEKYQSLNGKNYLCCYSQESINNINSADSDILRTDILAGKKISHCTKCYELENNKTISPRLVESIRWLRDPEVSNYINNWPIDNKLKTFFYDIRFDNKCNLACISCNQIDSSLWAKELGVNPPKYKLNFNIDDCLSAKKIYLAGGEPLIIDEFIELISKIANLDVQPELVINTNLTRINDKLRDKLIKIKKLSLTVSVDAFESVNEYHRWPMKWNKFIKNLTWVRTHLLCNVQFNTVVDAVSIINLDQLINIEHLADQWNLSIITSPSALLINNTPDNLKEQIADNFTKIKQSKFYRKDPTFKTKVDHTLKQIHLPGNSILLSNYINEIDQRRNINHTTYLGIKLT
jgi:sulfatase maturation enzyme AslB (radical SAM superfamily)